MISQTPAMPENPHESPQGDETPGSVTIIDINSFQMPHKCVVCGIEVPSLFSYVQDHMPVVLPGVGLVRTTEVSLPYCSEHQRDFQRRFRKLRIAQGVLYVILFVCAFTLLFEPVRLWFGWGPKPGIISGLFVGVVFLFLVITIFGIKPFLYDAFLKRSGDKIIIKSHSKTFIKNVIDANQSIVR